MLDEKFDFFAEFVDSVKDEILADESKTKLLTSLDKGIQPIVKCDG